MPTQHQPNAAMKLTAASVLAVLLLASPGHSQLLVSPFSCYALSYGRVSTIQRMDIEKDEYKFLAVYSCKVENGTFCYQAVFTEGNTLRIVEKDCCKEGFSACEKEPEEKK